MKRLSTKENKNYVKKFTDQQEMELRDTFSERKEKINKLTYHTNTRIYISIIPYNNIKTNRYKVLIIETCIYENEKSYYMT